MTLPRWQTVVMILMGIYILYLTECRIGKPCPEVTGSDTMWIPGDDSLIPYPVDVPYPFTITKPVLIPADIDTYAILQSYFSKLFYSDTIVEDSNFIAVISDSVFMNRITWRGFQLQNLRQTAVIITNQLENPARFKLFLGGSLNVGVGKFGAGPSVAILTKREF